MTSSNSREGKLSDLLNELKAEYQRNFPLKIQTLRSAFDKRDVPALTEEFHKLKGTGKTYGFPEVSVLCEAFEAACLRGSPDFAQIEKLFSVFARMQEAWKEDRHLDPLQDAVAESLLKAIDYQGHRKEKIMEALKELFSFLPAERIKSDAESCQHYGRDWTTYFDIKASAVLFPLNTEEVQKIVLWARRHHIALVPSGGRTGLSGSAVAAHGEVIVSFERMNQILSFDPIDASVRVQPGVVTETLQKFALEKGLFYPVDFAARGSSQIGGNIATNAGGIKVVRYGCTRDWVSSLTVVAGTGDVLVLNHGLVKNATGPDFRHLFIGSEGILGFITEATLRLAPPPPPLKVLLLALKDLDAVMKVFAAFKTRVTLSAFEMLSDKALVRVMENTGLARPLATEAPFYVVIEVEAPTDEAEARALEAFEQGLEAGWVLDGALASSEAQAKTFWRYREDISESLAKYSPYKNDISVRVSKVPDFLNQLEGLLAQAYPTWEVVWFGHVGDGNLHVNILRPQGMTKEEFVKECRQVDRLLFEVIQKCEGSISAEHGVGLTKKPFLTYTRSPAEIALLASVKKAFDPDGIMNPGKVLPS